MSDIPFTTPADARDYLAAEIDRMAKAHGKGAPTARVRCKAIAESLKAWATLHRLDHDTEEVRQLAEEIEELKRVMKGGPAGLVAHGQD